MENRAEFGIRDYSSENHWRKFSLDGFKLTKPTVFCFSGSGTISERDANGFCKFAESYALGVGDEKNNKKIDFVGVKYASENTRSGGMLSDEDVQDFVNNVLMPCCRGKSIDDSCKTLSLITFFTYCHGASETNNIVKTFREQLATEKYPEDDVKKLTDSLFEISYAKESSETECSEIALFSLVDNSLFEYWYGEDKIITDTVIALDREGEVFGKNFPRPRNAKSITVLAPSILKPTKKEFNFFEDHHSEEHPIYWLSLDQQGCTSPKLSKQGQDFSQIMQISLIERLKNSFENLNSKSYIPFDLEKLQKEIFQNISVAQTSETEKSRQI